MSISITVHGVPAPQGSKKYVGRGIMVESSQRVKPWREAVKHAALDEMDRIGFPVFADGAVALRVRFTFAKPKSAPKRRRSWPTTRASGDIDKLLRSTFDALTDAGLWRDDAQVCVVNAVKRYVGDPGAMQSPGAVIDVWAGGWDVTDDAEGAA